jgi:hypothetical protein
MAQDASTVLANRGDVHCRLKARGSRWIRPSSPPHPPSPRIASHTMPQPNMNLGHRPPPLTTQVKQGHAFPPPRMDPSVLYPPSVLLPHPSLHLISSPSPQCMPSPPPRGTPSSNPSHLKTASSLLSPQCVVLLTYFWPVGIPLIKGVVGITASQPSASVSPDAPRVRSSFPSR